MIIFRPSDKVRVQVGDVTVIMSPLISADRMKILDSLGTKVEAGQVGSSAGGYYEALRLSVKGIEAPGYELSDGSPIQLELDENGHLTSESLELLLAVLDNPKLIMIASNLLAKGLKNWEVEGVEIKGVEGDKPKKKA
jgi:hypothetical protein